jgi:hypothetical protein
MEDVAATLMTDYHLEDCQLDELWGYIFPMRNIQKSRMMGLSPMSLNFFTSYPVLAIISIMVCRLIGSILVEDQSNLDCLYFVTPSS